jgi:uncharacterized damage-inducible protein DinB
MTKRAVLQKALTATPKDLARLLRGLPRPDARPAANQWSAAEVINHLADVELLYLARLRLVVSEEQPPLPRIHPDESRFDKQATPAELLSRFEAARAETVTFLEGLPPGAWQRKGHHETQGQVSLRFLVQYLVEHDTNHLNQIVQIKEAGRVAA